MARSCEFSNLESKAFDYAEVYAALGYETKVLLDSAGNPQMSSYPRLAITFDLAIRLPEHDAPAAWM